MATPTIIYEAPWLLPPCSIGRRLEGKHHRQTQIHHPVSQTIILTMSEDLIFLLKNVRLPVFSLPMASDNDLFAKRLSWGFRKAYRVACAGGSVEEEAAAIVTAVRKALRQDFRLSAFPSMLTVALRACAEHEIGLFATSPSECERMIRAHLDVVERKFAELPATPEIEKTVESVAHEALEDGRAITASKFHAECSARLAQWLTNRLHFKPTETKVRKALQLDRLAVVARQEAVFKECCPAIMQLLTEAQTSKTGRPSRLKLLVKVDVNSFAGLHEALL